MRGIVIRTLAASTIAAAWPSSALAQDEPPADEEQAPEPSPAPAPAPPAPAPPRPPARPRVYAPPPRVITYQETRPNADLIGGGIALFGLTYGTSIIVGAQSDRTSDQFLFVPLVGPWMDLATRESCYGLCSPGEAANRVLLVTSGLLQGAGVLQILGGFLFPEERTVTRIVGAERGVHVAPSVGPRMVGLTAYGAF
jgi:hypothetical protein